SVHDHANTWGVAAVVRGQLEVDDYDIARRSGALTALRPSRHHAQVDGSLVGLVPPHDLHPCRHADRRHTAERLHLCRTPPDTVRRFVHVEDDLYRPEKVRLASV